MEWMVGVVAIIVSAVGPMAAVAFKNERKWPAFYRNVSTGAAAVFAFAGFAGTGVFFSLLFPQHVMPMLAALGFIAGTSIVVVLALMFANWLRS